MPGRLLILNATAVNEGRTFETDLLVSGSRIEEIGPNLSARQADETLDAAGLHLLPGMIDDQVHFREPGDVSSADFTTESRAAVAGGTTSVMDMPNNRPPITDFDRLARKIARGAGRMHTNYAFYFGATNHNTEATAQLHDQPVCGLKIFMGASTGDMLVDSEEALRLHFSRCRTLIATHCEHTPTIKAAQAEFAERYGADIPVSCHPEIRSRQACLTSSSHAVELARTHGSRLHVLHLTTADELGLFETGDCTGKRITAEVCVHHLVFCDEDYERYGARIKCNPAIKGAADRAALRAALAEDRIDVIATDHAPHLLHRKALPYADSPAGLPYIQHALPMVLELAAQGVLSLERAVHKTSHAPALCYGVEERGFLREGYHADLVLVDLRAPVRIGDAALLHRCGWSAFEGLEVRARVDTTIVSGRIAYRDGAVRAPRGLPLGFVRAE